MDIRECANCGRFKKEGHTCGIYIETCMRNGDAYSNWIPKNKETNMENNHRVLVDVEEFQEKILDYINSEEIDNMIRFTIFEDEPKCRSAIIHGMAIAAMLPSRCKQIYIAEDGK